MGVGTFFHHIGTFLLLGATALLIVVTITAPVINNLAILRVDLGSGISGDKITYGTFGYCHINVNGNDDCSKVHAGYDATDVLTDVAGISFSKNDHEGIQKLTKILVLHPIAAALTFVAFLLCLGTNMLGSFVASVFSGLAFVATLVAMACDFACFANIKNNVNNKSSANAEAHWAAGAWCVLVAAVCSLVATILVFITCCAGRSKNRSKDGGY